MLALTNLTHPTTPSVIPAPVAVPVTSDPVHPETALRQSIKAKLREADDFYHPSVKGKLNLEDLISVGNRLREAELLAKTDIRTLLDRWGYAGSLRFSVSMACCYVSLARHATVIWAAEVTRVKDAIRLARALGFVVWSKGNEVAENHKAEAAAKFTEYKRSILNDMRCLPVDSQSAFLANLMERLIRLQKLFEPVGV